LKARIDDEEEVRNLFDLAARLEDLTRNVGMHAGGVLIAPGKLPSTIRSPTRFSRTAIPPRFSRLNRRA